MCAVSQALDIFPEISDRIRNIVIENRDFEPLIKTYDRPGALVYLDPALLQGRGSVKNVIISNCGIIVILQISCKKVKKKSASLMA
jgi:hypothetical protein